MNSPTKGVAGRTIRRRKGNAPDVSHPVRRRRVGFSQLRPLCGQAVRATGGEPWSVPAPCGRSRPAGCPGRAGPFAARRPGADGREFGERLRLWGPVCPCRPVLQPLKPPGTARLGQHHPVPGDGHTLAVCVHVPCACTACMYRVTGRAARVRAAVLGCVRQGCQGAVCPLRPVLRRARPGRREQHARTRRPAVLGQGHVLAGLLRESDQAAEVLDGVRQFDTVDGRDATDRRALAVSRS